MRKAFYSFDPRNDTPETKKLIENQDIGLVNVRKLMSREKGNRNAVPNLNHSNAIIRAIFDAVAKKHEIWAKMLDFWDLL